MAMALTVYCRECGRGVLVSDHLPALCIGCGGYVWETRPPWVLSEMDRRLLRSLKIGWD